MPVTDNEVVKVVLTILWVLGGLGLFLYGIELMGDSLRKAAGTALRRSLDFLTRTRFHGLLTGVVITGLVQSSSATTVMVVGFISAGLLAFPQSIGLILGANIGSTITPQITAWDLDELAIPVIGIGFLLNFLSRRRISRQFGMALMGFGMLFLGLVLMKLAVKGYSGEIKSALEFCTQGGIGGILTAFLVSLAVTSVIQSSAATVVMIQALALDGAINEIGIAIPIIVGANVGTCVTAMLASLKASRSARKAAIAHLLFNVIGVFITIALYRFYVWFVPHTALTLPHQIANAHMFIKLAAVLVVLPFSSAFAGLVNRLLPGVDKFNAAPEYLNQSDLSDRVKALNNVEREIRRMCVICVEMVNDAVSAFFAHNDMEGERVKRRESLVDDLYESVTGYVLEISKRGLPNGLAGRPPHLMHLMGDIERIGDHAENIVETINAFGKENASLSKEAESDLRMLTKMVITMGDRVVRLFESVSKKEAEEVINLREEVYSVSREMIEAHERRLAAGECTVIAGIAFVGLITNLKRVSNHLRNAAASLGSAAKPDRAEV